MPFKSAILSTNLGICSHLACKLCSSKLFTGDVADANPFPVLISQQLACEHATEHFTNALDHHYTSDHHCTSDHFYCYPLYGNLNYLFYPKK
jgi:hypothetical protein